MAQYVAWTALNGQSGHDAGRQLLRQLYNTHVGGPMPAIVTEPKGKPRFAQGDWHFSISHCKTHAFCVLADRQIGIDAEEKSRQIRLDLAPKILSSGELAQFQGAEDPRDALLRFWILKEAAAKCSGEGMGFHPRHTNFTLPDSRITEIDGCLVAVID